MQLKKKFFRNAREWKLRIWDPKHKTNFARESDTSPPSRPLHARALTGDRARERGAEKRADAPIHLIKRLQELGAGKYALFTYSLSPFIFFLAKKRKTRKIGRKEREKEKEKEKEKLLYLYLKTHFFFISSSLSRARICAHLRAHIISLFFACARARARESHTHCYHR